LIGLEIVLKVFGMSSMELARKLNINRANISMWFSGKRKIPSDRIVELSAIFKGIPSEYFQKELRKSEELEVQMIYLQQTDTSETVEVPVTDENGKIVGWGEESYSDHAGFIDFLDTRQSIEALKERIEDLVEEDKDDETARVLLDQILDTIEFGEEDQKNFLRVLFQYLNIGDYSDFTEEYEELKQYLKKNNLLKKQKQDEEK
jgi:transcriptional regulator with XRE-family HTH domain